MNKIKDDHHAAFVLEYGEYEGTPYIVHEAGHYPSLVNENGARIDRKIAVVKTRNGYIVSAHLGYHNGMLRSVKAGFGDDFYSHFPRALEILNGEAEHLYAIWEDMLSDLSPYYPGVNREEYEQLCAEWGIAPQDDSKCLTWGRFEFPEYPLRDIPSLLLAQKRAIRIERDKEAIEVEKRKQREQEAQSLRKMPVVRTYTELTPRPTRSHRVVDGQLHQIISQKRKRLITEDDPSVLGSQFLGHEGEPLFEVTVEVRGAR